MTNAQKYNRMFDLVIFAVLVILASTGFYLLGDVRGRTHANEACDAMRAEHAGKILQKLQNLPPPKRANQGTYREHS